ncbi:MAG: lipid-A-disaccharide synthase, partial [Alphaproteobacteria bacterium]|nr:lipid-A-disaccharide synthase [Alphaproteobacteria bacterium]
WEGQPTVIIPTLPALRPMIAADLHNWNANVHFVEGEDDKFRAFKLADAALAASGTVTLELALTGTPAVVAYRVDAVASQLKYFIKAQSIVLANLVAGHNIYPECIQERCTPVRLARALAPLLSDTPERSTQRLALAHIPKVMNIPGTTPSAKAAEIVLDYAAGKRKVF